MLNRVALLANLFLGLMVAWASLLDSRKLKTLSGSLIGGTGRLLRSNTNGPASRQKRKAIGTTSPDYYLTTLNLISHLNVKFERQITIGDAAIAKSYFQTTPQARNLPLPVISLNPSS